MFAALSRFTTKASPAKPSIRWTIRRDLPGVLACEADQPDAWTEADFYRVLRHTSCIGMVAEAGYGRVIGHCVYRLQTRRLDVLRVCVHPDHRRQGIGSHLAAKLAAKLDCHRRQALTAVVPDDNLAAQMFFRSAGYRCISTLRGHFGESDGYRMTFRLPTY